MLARPVNIFTWQVAGGLDRSWGAAGWAGGCVRLRRPAGADRGSRADGMEPRPGGSAAGRRRGGGLPGGGAAAAAHGWALAGRPHGLPGLGSVLLATAGWIGSYAHVLLWAYTLQVIVLLLVAPLFLLLGRPGQLLSAAWLAGDGGQRRGGRGWRWLRPVTSSVVGPALVPVVLGVTSLLGWSLRHQPVYLALHVLLLAVGLLIAAPLAGADAATTSLSVAAVTFVGFLELLLDAVPGMVLRLKTQLLAPGWFVGVHRPWGPTPLGDQRGRRRPVRRGDPASRGAALTEGRRPCPLVIDFSWPLLTNHGLREHHQRAGDAPSRVSLLLGPRFAKGEFFRDGCLQLAHRASAAASRQPARACICISYMEHV